MCLAILAGEPPKVGFASAACVPAAAVRGREPERSRVLIITAAMRMRGGFDKIADDDSQYEDLHDLLDDIDDDGAPPPLGLKAQMNREVLPTAPARPHALPSVLRDPCAQEAGNSAR